MLLNRCHGAIREHADGGTARVTVPRVPDVLPSRWRASPARFARVVLGCAIFGVGEGVLVHSALGNSPWSVLAGGVTQQTGVAIGTVTIAISFLLLLIWIPLRQRPGLGTIVNAVVVGLAIDGTLMVLGDGSDLRVVRALEVLLAIAVVSVGSGIYLTARLGPGPRDGLMTGLALKTGHSIRLTRGSIELTAAAIGVALGGTIGIGTLAFALLIGPGVQLALGRLGAFGAADL